METSRTIQEEIEEAKRKVETLSNENTKVEKFNPNSSDAYCYGVLSRHNKEFVYKNRWTNSVKFQDACADDGTGGRLKIWFEAHIGLGRHKATSLEHV